MVLLAGSGYIFRKVIADKTGMVALVLSGALVDFTNQDRKLKDISDLKVNPLLAQAAELKAKDMVEKGYFAHESPEGHSPWYWLDQVGYDFSYAGENLAVNFDESIDVNEAWLNSPKHKENIMNGNFTEIGIAVIDGMYKGKMTTFVVQFFGKPAKKVTSVRNDKVINSVTVKTNLATSTPAKIATTSSSAVLGETGENSLYVAVEKISKEENVKKSFWSYFIPSWFSK